MEDLISVIVPIYRGEQYLDQCIQSIREQTYKNLEIILVDDGSDDQCPKMCDFYAQEDKRIKVIHKENGGLDSARKAGILTATGKYVGYVDGDDWIEPNMYEVLLEYAHRYDVEIVESGVIDSWTNREVKRTSLLEEGCYKREDFIDKIEPRLLYSGTFFEHGITPYMFSKLFLREKIMKYQVMAGITNRIYDDIMVSLPCIAESRNIYISHNCYYHYRVRTDSLKRKNGINVVKNLYACYPDFYSRFKGTKLCSKDDKQIKYFAMYQILYKSPYALDKSYENTFLPQFGGLKIEDRVVLYGAGSAGIQLQNYIQSVEGSNIVCWVDQNYKDLQKTLDVKNPKEIMNYDFDYVIISILRANAVKSAKNDLIKLGVPEDKILWIEQKYIDNPDLLLSKVIHQGQSLV